MKCLFYTIVVEKITNRCVIFIEPCHYQIFIEPSTFPRTKVHFTRHQTRVQKSLPLRWINEDARLVTDWIRTTLAMYFWLVTRLLILNACVIASTAIKCEKRNLFEYFLWCRHQGSVLWNEIKINKKGNETTITGTKTKQKKWSNVDLIVKFFLYQTVNG